MGDKCSDKVIATESQSSLSMIHKQLYNCKPHQHAENEHKEILQGIVALLLHRTKHNSHTTFIEAHIGIAGSEVADLLAGEATESSFCEQVVSLGKYRPQGYVLAHQANAASIAQRKSAQRSVGRWAI